MMSNDYEAVRNYEVETDRVLSIVNQPSRETARKINRPARRQVRSRSDLFFGIADAVLAGACVFVCVVALVTQQWLYAGLSALLAINRAYSAYYTLT